MAVGRQRAGRPIAGLTCNMRERGNSKGVGRDWAAAQRLPGRARVLPSVDDEAGAREGFRPGLGPGGPGSCGPCLDRGQFRPEPGAGGADLIGSRRFHSHLCRPLERLHHQEICRHTRWPCDALPLGAFVASWRRGQTCSHPNGVQDYRPARQSADTLWEFIRASTLAKKLPIGLGSSFSPSCAGIVAVSASHPDHRQLLTQIVAPLPRLRTSQGDAPAP